MGETFGRPDDMPVWHAAVNGTSPDWDAFLAEYVATVDWPACAFWRELADANPDAVVLLSTRSSADAWWKSAHDTIFQVPKREIPPDAPPVFGAQMAMATDLFVHDLHARAGTTRPTAKRAYEDHNARRARRRRSGAARRVAAGRRLGAALRRAGRRGARPTRSPTSTAPPTSAP